MLLDHVKHAIKTNLMLLDVRYKLATLANVAFFFYKMVLDFFLLAEVPRTRPNYTKWNSSTNIFVYSTFISHSTVSYTLFRSIFLPYNNAPNSWKYYNRNTYDVTYY